MSAEQLIADAHQNLFQAKRLGRNRMIAVDPEKVLLAG
jgi:PleD family two-component response regulator